MRDYPVLNNYSTPNTSNKKKILFVVGMTIIVIIIFTAIAIVSSIPKSTEEDDTSYTITDPKETTPILQIYAAIDNETPTFENLEETVHDINSEAIIRINSLGIGYITLPNTIDQIVFDYYDEPGTDPTTGEPVLASKDETYDPTTDFITPQPDKTIKHIRYNLPLGEDCYYIDYSDEEEEYIVYNLMTTFEYPTKKDAIEAYLASEAIEQLPQE